MKSFHNTISAVGPQLDLFESQAKTQEEKVLRVFRLYNKPLAWSEVKVLLGEDMHEGSIKRAVTNLKDQGCLFRTSEMILGPYGKAIHKYKLK